MSEVYSTPEHDTPEPQAVSVDTLALSAAATIFSTRSGYGPYEVTTTRCAVRRCVNATLLSLTFLPESWGT